MSKGAEESNAQPLGSLAGKTRRASVIASLDAAIRHDWCRFLASALQVVQVPLCGQIGAHRGSRRASTGSSEPNLIPIKAAYPFARCHSEQRSLYRDGREARERLRQEANGHEDGRTSGHKSTRRLRGQQGSGARAGSRPCATACSKPSRRSRTRPKARPAARARRRGASPARRGPAKKAAAA